MLSRTRVVAPLLLAIAVFGLACGDNDVTSGPPPEPEVFSGHVVSVFDTVAVANATVALIEGVPYRVVAGPLTTDTDGYFEFSDPPIGEFYLFVFTGNMLMLDAADARVTIRRGQRIDRDIEMIPSELWNGGPPLIVGTVTDAVTGEPISGAYVSGFLTSVYHNFLGVMIDAEGLTDQAGRYSVTALNLLLDSTGNPLSVVHPLGVSKEGYAPFYTMNVPMSDPPDSINVVDVALERPSGGGTIRGRVVRGSSPLDDIAVALDYVTIPLDTLIGDASAKDVSVPQRVPLLGMATRTDNRGRFEIKNVPVGTFFIDAAYLANDGYVSAFDESGMLDIAADEVVDVGDIAVLPAIRPIAPSNQQRLTDRSPLLSWEAVAGADYYRLSAGSGHFLDFERTITENQFQFDQELPSGITVRWVVTAFRTGSPYDEEVAAFEVPSTFVVE